MYNMDKRLVIELPQGLVLNDPNAPPKPTPVGKPAPEGYTNHGALITSTPNNNRVTSTAIPIQPSVLTAQLCILAFLSIVFIHGFTLKWDGLKNKIRHFIK